LIVINNASTVGDFQIIEDLATTIWTKHYTPIIGKGQVDYMLHKFQSVTTIKDQINQGVNYYILYYSKVAVGYFSIVKKETSLFLNKLYVLDSMRGKGIGKKAILFIDEKALELDCKTISLTVNKYNTNAIKAYEKMRFVTIKAIVQDIGNGYVMDDFYMEKQLQTNLN